MVQELVYLFNKVLECGYHEDWATTTLVHVPKPQGKPMMMDDYMGIAVS
jgi:hypothetical protein